MSSPNPIAFFPISPLMIFPEALGEFSVFLKQGSNYVLYAGSDEAFTERHRKALHELGITEVYVRSEQRPAFTEYVEDNLGKILGDESIPLPERSGVFYEASANVIEGVFTEKLPGSLQEESFQRVTRIVETSLDFVAQEKTLKAMSSFISHDYRTYTHCIHVFLYTVCVLQSFDMERDILFEAGLGAMLHDLGKTRIPVEILNKPGPLSPSEREVVSMHSVHGVSMCANLALPHLTLNCILCHHEKLDGTGYPSRISGEDIPLPVRAVTVTDIYDALSSHRPYAPARTAFESLNFMRTRMADGLDMGIFKRFVEILSGADLLGK